MVFYFSGTGNSQLAAKTIANCTGDEIVSINRCIKENKIQTFISKSPLVFVAPVYGWRMPKAVEKWIAQTQFEGSKDAYFILTCGGDGGNAWAYTKKLCKKKGFEFKGLSAVLMPENYIAMSSAPDEQECGKLIKNATEVFEQLAKLIIKGENLPKTTVTFADKIKSGPINVIFYKFMVKDKGFTVSNACINCGKCAQRCPLNNVAFKNSKPIWQGNCTHCMACICGCPTQAIEYKSLSKGKRRYYIAQD